MKTEYAEHPGEEWMNWMRRIYKIAHEEAERKGGWAHVDEELKTILLNNFEKLLF